MFTIVSAKAAAQITGALGVINLSNLLAKIIFPRYTSRCLILPGLLIFNFSLILYKKYYPIVKFIKCVT